MGGGVLDIIFFAIVATFLAIKLFKVLGQDDRENEEKLTPRENLQDVIEDSIREIYSYEEVDKLVKGGNKEHVRQSVAKIREIDDSFTLNGFMAGAKIALEMIFKAFNREDKKTLKGLLGAELYKQFEETIEEQSKIGEKAEKTLVAIVDAEIEEVSLKKNVAEITVKFVTEQINFSKNKLGKIVTGSASNIEKIEDTWKFTKDLTNSDPTWFLSAIV